MPTSTRRTTDLRKPRRIRGYPWAMLASPPTRCLDIRRPPAVSCGGLCQEKRITAPLRLYAYENLPQLSAVISRKATGEDLLFAPAAAGKQRLCMKPRAGQKQYGTKQPAGVGARPFESIFYGSVLSILRASAANSGSIVRRLCDFSSPISSCISVIDFPCARR